MGAYTKIWKNAFAALALTLATVRVPCCWGRPSWALEPTLWNSNIHWRPLTHPASGTEQLMDSRTFRGETATVGLPGPQPINHSNKSPSTYRFIPSFLLLYRTLIHLPLFYSPAWPWTLDPPALASVMHIPLSQAEDSTDKCVCYKYF